MSKYRISVKHYLKFWERSSSPKLDDCAPARHYVFANSPTVAAVEDVDLPNDRFFEEAACEVKKGGGFGV
jgi:hypothetical protein